MFHVQFPTRFFARTGRRRRAFTLAEVLIVLALLLIILAISWPSIVNLNRKQQLKQSALLVQTQLSVARVRAIENSTAYEFSFDESGRRYLLTPSLKANEIVLPSSGNRPTAKELKSIAGELPAGIVFARRVGHANGVKSKKVTEENWSTPIIFYPDGTSDQSELRLLDEVGQFITIKIRGLTGMAKVGRLRKV